MKENEGRVATADKTKIYYNRVSTTRWLMIGGVILICVLSQVLPGVTLDDLLIAVGPFLFLGYMFLNTFCWKCPECGVSFEKTHKPGECENCGIEFPKKK